MEGGMGRWMEGGMNRHVDECMDRRTTDKTWHDKIILLSGLRPITMGVNIQIILIFMASPICLNFVF